MTTKICERMRGTIYPTSNFNPENDAKTLAAAMEGKGYQPKFITDILCRRTARERNEIAGVYKALYGKELTKDLLKELKGDYEYLMVSLCDTLPEFDAKELNRAMKGLGTDEDLLVEILVTRSNQELKDIKEAYQRLFKKDLEKTVASETSSGFKNFLIALLQAERDYCPGGKCGDINKIREDANLIYNNGKKFDLDNLNAIFCKRAECHLKFVFEEYRKITGASTDIVTALKKQLSGDTENGFLTLYKVVDDKQAFFAEKLYNAMKGRGMKEKDVIRILITRSEKDLYHIKEAYQRLYGQSLASAIAADSKGDLEAGLLTLLDEPVPPPKSK